MNKKNINQKDLLKRMFSFLFLMLLFLSMMPIKNVSAVAYSITVTELDDSFVGPDCSDSSSTCTLREAITLANANVDTDIIVFDETAAAAASYVVDVDSPLPEIIYPVDISGTDVGVTMTLQPSGSYVAGGGTTDTGLRFGVDADISSLTEFIIQNFAYDGLTIKADYVTVDGVYLLGNTNNGVTVSNATNAVLQNMRIGSNTVNGVEFSGGTSASQIETSKIGVNNDGVTANANGAAGVFISASPGNFIDNNQISANTTDGVHLSGSASIGNQITNNKIGTNALGTADLGNTGNGVSINAAVGTLVGTLGNGNLISGNTLNGIYIYAQATGTIVYNNKIGTATDGTSDLGNDGSGVLIFGADSNQVKNNTIAFNGTGASTADGVTVNSNGDYGVSNKISQNSMFSNDNLAIDLMVDSSEEGSTANDADDSDTGGNTLQNYPVLTSALRGKDFITVGGSLTSTASTTFTIEFFKDVQGGTYLYSKDVTTDGAGLGSFEAVIPQAIAIGEKIYTVAHDGSNTSEFSASETVSTAFPTIVVTLGNDANKDGTYSDGETATVAGQTVNFRVTIENSTADEVTINSFYDTEYDAEISSGTCDNLVGTTLAGNSTITCLYPGVLTIGVTQITNTTEVEAEDFDGDTDISTDWTLVYTTLPVEPTNTPVTPSSGGGSSGTINTSTPWPTSTIFYTPTITPTPTLSWPVLTLTAMAEDAGIDLTATSPVFSSPTSTLVPSATAVGENAKTATSVSVLDQISNLERTATTMAIMANATDEAETSPVEDEVGFEIENIWYFIIPAGLLLIGGASIELFRWLKLRKQDTE